jgi:hypothetical protein
MTSLTDAKTAGSDAYKGTPEGSGEPRESGLRRACVLKLQQLNESYIFFRSLHSALDEKTRRHPRARSRGWCGRTPDTYAQTQDGLERCCLRSRAGHEGGGSPLMYGRVLHLVPVAVDVASAAVYQSCRWTARSKRAVSHQEQMGRIRKYAGICRRQAGLVCWKRLILGDFAWAALR